MSAAHRIILLDNDERIVELISWFLTSKGFEVRTAQTFAQLDALVAEGSCDLLLSDVDLGAESALVELPRRSALKTLPRTLVVSGFLDAANQVVLDAVPEVVGSISKPFEFEDLLARVLGVLDGAAEEPSEPAAPAREEEEVRPEDDDGWIEITPPV